VKVKRLDAESIKRWIGTCVTSDDSYYIYGYFFDSKGNYISKVSPQKPVGLLNRIYAFFRDGSNTSIEEALWQCANKDEVRYVILFGHDLNHYCSLQLYVYKMPQGCTASELLKEMADQRAQKLNTEAVAASEEIRVELTELSE